MEATGPRRPRPRHVDLSALPSHHRPFVERAADYGNVAYVECRKCGTPNLLDPRRMEGNSLGVFLLCTQCWLRFVVRRSDLGRPVPGWVPSHSAFPDMLLSLSAFALRLVR